MAQRWGLCGGNLFTVIDRPQRQKKKDKNERDHKGKPDKTQDRVERGGQLSNRRRGSRKKTSRLAGGESKKEGKASGRSLARAAWA